MKQWDISVSTRLKSELLKLKLQRKSDDPDERLFASASVNLRKVWEAARKEAGKQAIPNHAREPLRPQPTIESCSEPASESQRFRRVLVNRNV